MILPEQQAVAHRCGAAGNPAEGACGRQARDQRDDYAAAQERAFRPGAPAGGHRGDLRIRQLHRAGAVHLPAHQPRA